eukprot:767252-Hanusia_phi.AAC.3
MGGRSSAAVCLTGVREGRRRERRRHLSEDEASRVGGDIEGKQGVAVASLSVCTSSNEEGSAAVGGGGAGPVQGRPALLVLGLHLHKSSEPLHPRLPPLTSALASTRSLTISGCSDRQA